MTDAPKRGNLSFCTVVLLPAAVVAIWTGCPQGGWLDWCWGTAGRAGVGGRGGASAHEGRGGVLWGLAAVCRFAAVGSMAGPMSGPGGPERGTGQGWPWAAALASVSGGQRRHDAAARTGQAIAAREAMDGKILPSVARTVCAKDGTYCELPGRCAEEVRGGSGGQAAGLRLGVGHHARGRVRADTRERLITLGGVYGSTLVERASRSGACVSGSSVIH